MARSFKEQPACSLQELNEIGLFSCSQAFNPRLPSLNSW